MWCVPITPPCAPRLHAPLSGPTHGRVAHDPASDLSQGFAEVPLALFGGLLWGSSKNSRHLRKINIVFCARRCGVCGEHAMEVVVMEAKEMLAMAQGASGRQGSIFSDCDTLCARMHQLSLAPQPCMTAASQPARVLGTLPVSAQSHTTGSRRLDFEAGVHCCRLSC
mgnify:CR=1 FL=1